MRKIILQVATSLDGYIEDADGSFDWLSDPDYGTGQDYGMAQFLKRIDTLFMGRKTFDLVKSMPVDPDDPFAKSMSHVKQYVFTQNKQLQSDNQYTIVHENTYSWIKEYKITMGGDIWLFGGAVFTKNLLEAKLVDELILAIHPILLGNGKKFNEGQTERLKLKFIGNKEYDSGIILSSYAVL